MKDIKERGRTLAFNIGLSKTFSAFKSRWAIPCEWSAAIPAESSNENERPRRRLKGATLKYFATSQR